MRIEDQLIEGKRGTGTAGAGVQSLDVVLTRYRAAVDCNRELAPNFVVMAQCYVAEAANGGFEESLVRMKAHKEIAEVGWAQPTAPRSVEQVKRARDAVGGPFSIMQAYMDPPLSNEELLNLGINLSWMPRPTHDVTYVALYDFIEGEPIPGRRSEDWRRPGGEAAGTGREVSIRRFLGEIRPLHRERALAIFRRSRRSGFDEKEGGGLSHRPPF